MIGTKKSREGKDQEQQRDLTEQERIELAQKFEKAKSDKIVDMFLRFG